MEINSKKIKSSIFKKLPVISRAAFFYLNKKTEALNWLL